MTISRKILSSLCCVGLFGATVAAHASSFSFTSAGVGTVTGTTGAGTITLTLTSLDNVNISDAQALAGVLLTLSNAAGTTSLSSSSGDVITIGAGPGGGTFGYTDDGVSSPLGHWGATSPTTDVVCVATVSGNGSNCGGTAQPFDLLIGSPNGSGDYNETGNMSNFDPFVLDSATFTIAASGVTSATMVTAATFGTGTDFTNNTSTSNPPVTPEPSSLMLLGTGIVGAAGLLRRRMAGDPNRG